MRNDLDSIEMMIDMINKLVDDLEGKSKFVTEVGIESVSLSDSDPETVKASEKIQRSLANIRENIENLNGIAGKLKEILFYDVCPQPPDLTKIISK